MEMLEIYDENNNDLGYDLERKEVHEKNLYHHHVSAWIMNNEGKILLQQRSFTKKKNPGKWAKTGGHVESNETEEYAIKREVFEEIGIKLKDNQIKNIEIFKSKSKENYYTYGYIIFTNLKENEFILQKEEVEKVKYFEIEELEKIRKNNDEKYTFCKWDEEGFKKQIDLLKKYKDEVIKNDKTK